MNFEWNGENDFYKVDSLNKLIKINNGIYYSLKQKLFVEWKWKSSVEEVYLYFKEKFNININQNEFIISGGMLVNHVNSCKSSMYICDDWGILKKYEVIFKKIDDEMDIISISQIWERIEDENVDTKIKKIKDEINNKNSIEYMNKICAPYLFQILNAKFVTKQLMGQVNDKLSVTIKLFNSIKEQFENKQYITINQYNMLYRWMIIAEKQQFIKMLFNNGILSKEEAIAKIIELVKNDEKKALKAELEMEFITKDEYKKMIKNIK